MERWEDLDGKTKENIFKYLKLMKRFNKDPNLLKPDHKKWMLENCTLPTELVPEDQMSEYWLI